MELKAVKALAPTLATGKSMIVSCSHRRWRQAFTLMELMVVLMLIALLSAVIVPEMRGSFEDAILRASTRQFIDAFSLASSRSVSLNQTHRIRLDRAAGQYVLEQRAGGDARRPRFEPVRDSSASRGRIDSRVRWDLRAADTEPVAPGSGTDSGAKNGIPSRPTLGSPPDTIQFFPDGTADAAELTLEDRAGVRLALRINPVTGRVRLMEAKRP